jgi:hypothetical protein
MKSVFKILLTIIIAMIMILVLDKIALYSGWDEIEFKTHFLIVIYVAEMIKKVKIEVVR